MKQRRTWGSLGMLLSSWIKQFKSEELLVPEIDPETLYLTLHNVVGSKRKELYNMLAKLEVDYSLVRAEDFDDDDE